LTVVLSSGQSLRFVDPPRFYEPDTIEWTRWKFECEAPETPIFFDGPCVDGDLIEACHPVEGCLQISRGAFTWLSTSGEQIASGRGNFQDESLVSEDPLASLVRVAGRLGEQIDPLATFTGTVCRLNRDDCLK